MKKGFIILAIGCAVLGTSSVEAQQPRRVPAAPWPIEYVQPNGDTLIVRLHGDERKSWRTTADGYLIYKNKRGVYCYAKQRKNGTTYATCRVAHNAEQRTEKEQKWIDKHIQKTNK